MSVNIDLEDPSIYRDLVLLYCPKKVGSTSVVSSIRLYASDKYYVLHTHDNTVFRTGLPYKNLTVRDILKNNCVLNKLTNEPRKIYVIDIFRTPIERKISEYFEDLVTVHFNNLPENLINYPLEKVINRFNDIFPYISTTDYYKDIYNVPYPKEFDFENKYLLYTSNNITWIKLRLQDSDEWSSILTKILGTEIKILKDYQTENKNIGLLYEKIKKDYKLPYNYFQLISNLDELNYYLNDQEKEEYLEKWNKKIIGIYNSFSKNEFNLYVRISNENQFYTITKSRHYFDNGCICKLCFENRNKIIQIMNNNKKIFNLKKYDPILHENNSDYKCNIFIKCFYDDGKIVDMVYQVY